MAGRLGTSPHRPIAPLPHRSDAATPLASNKCRVCSILIAETTLHGFVLRLAVILPLEMYTPERLQEFDTAEAKPAATLAGRKF